MRAILLIVTVCVAAPALAQQQQQPQTAVVAPAETPTVPTQVEDCPFYDFHRVGGETQRVVRVCNRQSTERVKFFWDQQERSGGSD